MRRDDAALEELALGREVQPVVQHAGVRDGDELVAERADLAVERQAFDVDVRVAQDREAGGLVAAARFDADEAVLDDVDAADAVFAGEGVGGEEEFGGVGFRAGRGRADRDGDTFLELNRHVLGFVGC